MPLFLGEFAGKRRGGLPARHACAGCSTGPTTWALRVTAAAEFEFFLFEETPHSVREKRFRNLKHDHAGLLRLFDAARWRACRFLPRAPGRSARRWAFRDRGPAHRDGPGRARSRDPGRRCARGGRQGGAVQDLHQDPRPAPRLDGDLHGEMVARLAGPVRPSPHLAARTQKTARARFHDAKKPHQHVATRCAGSSAASRR